MQKNSHNPRFEILAVAVFLLATVWTTAIYELNRSKDAYLREGEIRTAVQAQFFAEYSVNTFKRVNELLLDLRAGWKDDWKAYAQLIQKRQESIKDITFQVTIIDKDGLVSFSNLARPTDRTDLSQREHFKVHKDAPDADRLFISKPVKGKISGKWSLQFTRPILKNGVFDGVIVISVSPQFFAKFGEHLHMQNNSALAMVRDTGEFMTRFPFREDVLVKKVTDAPLLDPNAPEAGNFRRLANADGVDRIYGYYKVKDFNLNFLAADAVDELLKPYERHRTNVLLMAFAVSLLVLAFTFLLLRTFKTLMAVRQQLEDAKNRAEAANVAKSRFLATMSHEIRTPLNGVIGIASLMQDGELSPQQRQYANLIEGSAQSLALIINDILDFSKIEAGKLEIEHADFDLHASLNQLSRLYALRVSEKSIKYSMWMDPAVPQWINGDQTRIRQVIDNLLSNALKFTQSGSIRLKIDMDSSSVAGQSLRIEIADSGVGIPEEVQKQLFSAFTQADASTTRRFGGTGLGLAISKQLVEMMGGSIELQSVEGKGTTFIVRIPLILATSRVEAPAVTTQPLLKGETYPDQILLAEDNPTNQMVTVGLLHRLGYRNITVAEDGREVLAQCAQGAFDVILMDCQMPNMDGYEATRELRRQGWKKPIIAMTANAVAGDRELCLAAGMDDYLSKPVARDLLSDTLARWLRPIPSEAAAPVSVSRSEAPGEVPPEEAPVFDPRAALENMDGDHELFDTLLGLARDDLPHTLAQLRESLVAGNAADLVRHAHTIKGAAASIGALALSSRAAQVELSARQGGVEAVMSDAPGQIERELTKFIEAAKAWQGNKPGN